jgi:4-hydroxy-tetrahydrodipicolinate synthase
MGGNHFSVRGVIPSLITPFTPDGDISWEEVEKNTGLLDRAGVDGICIGGCLSETAGGTSEELFRLCHTARVATRKPILASIFPDSEPEAIELLDAVCGAGADAVLVAQPHYLFQPEASALLAMFRRLSLRAPVPVLLANVLDSAQVSLETITRLIEEGVIDGIVQGARNAHLLVDLLRLKPRVPVFSNLEDLHYVGLVLGAEGVVSDLAAIFPEEYVGLYRDATAGNHEKARRQHEKLLRVWRVLDHPVEQLARVRLALGAQGRQAGPPRSPYALTSSESTAQVTAVLQREGFAVV